MANPDNYRSNANGMSMQDQIDKLNSRIDHNSMGPKDQYNLKLNRIYVGGAILLLLLGGSLGFGCNHEDNQTKKEVAKMCPAVSPILAVGLKQDSK